MFTAVTSLVANLKFSCSVRLLSHKDGVFLCSGIRSVSFYEHIVTVGTGLGSLLFYDIRAQRFLEKPLNVTGGYRKCPGEGILKLTTGKGWVVRCPRRLQPAAAAPPPPAANLCFGFRITTRRGGATSRTSIPSPTRSTRTATTTPAPSCSWRAGRCVPACTATTQGCGASLPFLSSIFVHPVPPSSPGPGHAAVLRTPARLAVPRGPRSLIWTPTPPALNIVAVCFRAPPLSSLFLLQPRCSVFISKCTDLLRTCVYFLSKAAESATRTQEFSET